MKQPITNFFVKMKELFFVAITYIFIAADEKTNDESSEAK